MRKFERRRDLIDPETGYFRTPPESQADAITRKFGGVEAFANAIGVSPSTVYRWHYSRKNQGTGGLIPSQKHAAVRRAARLEGIVLTRADWFPNDVI